MIPDEASLSRYVSFARHDNNIPNGAAYRLKEGEPGLSTNWLEIQSGTDSRERLNDLMRVTSLTVRLSGIFAVHRKGRLVESVERETPDRRKLVVVNDQDPEPSHCIVTGYGHDDQVIADIIAETYHEVFSVRELQV